MTRLPHVGQNFQPISISALQAGHCMTVMFCPQCGQNVTERSLGSTPPQ